MGMVSRGRILRSVLLMRSTVLLGLLCLSFIGPARADDDALPIVKKAFGAAQANTAIASSYVFHERIEYRIFGKTGEEKARESETYDVTLLDSSAYRRLIALNDEALSEKRENKEQQKVEKQVKKMQKETPQQREKRLAKVEKEHEEKEKFLEEITRAFDFRLTGEEEIDGVATHVVSAEPKEGFEPSSREAKTLPKIHGTLWISQVDHAWVKVDLETLDHIKWSVFKLNEGAIVRFTQRRVNDEVWLLDNGYRRLRSKAALVFKIDAQVTGSYSDYRRFTTDSTVVEEDSTRCAHSRPRRRD